MAGFSEQRGTFAEATATVPAKKPSWVDQLAWARENVPGEHPGHAAMAGLVLAAAGVPVTVTAIRARLVASGRDVATLEALDA